MICKDKSAPTPFGLDPVGHLDHGRGRVRLWAQTGQMVKHAADDGPQEITVHGRSVAVVISRALFDRLSGNQASLVDFMRQSPLFDQNDIEFERDRSLSREVDF